MDGPMSCGHFEQVSAQVRLVGAPEQSEGNGLTRRQAVIYPTRQRETKHTHQVFFCFFFPGKPILRSIVVAFNSLKFIVTHVTNRAELAAAECWS